VREDAPHHGRVLDRGGEVEATAARLAGGEKCPRSVVFAAELPREPQGKVRKRELRDAHWVGRATRV
jgi:acyl-CoA synthetase (AMP-forming)/AMP-acid ligase II